MAPPSIVAAALADALLTEPASPRVLAAQWTKALGFEKPPAWLRRMAARSLARVADLPRNHARAVVEMLARDPAFVQACREHPLVVRRWPVVEERMRPAPGPPTGWQVPSLPTSGDLAQWLGLSIAELDWFAGAQGRSGRTPPGPLAHYTCRWHPKRSGGLRLIEAPKSRLRAIQQRVLHEILDRVPPHDAAHGFTPRRSIRTHAAIHAGSAVVLVVDLASFFASVRASRVFALFRTLGYPEPVTRVLTGLVTSATPAAVWATAPRPTSAREVRSRFADRRFYRAPHLPQGAPTSPALANLCAYRLDLRLATASAACGARYSRYADDLTFSGGPDLAARPRAFLELVERVVAEEGFVVNGEKTRVLRPSVRQVVTGLVVNERPNVPRHELDRLEAILYNARRDGPASQNRDALPDFRAHLQGRVAWVASVSPRRATKLRALLEAIDWSR